MKVTEQFVIERYSHVMHISSNVEGRLKAGKTAMDVLRAALPVGTLSGAPKIRAMEIIDELEPVKRGIYGGAVGYLSWNGNMDTAIAIRTAVVKNGTLYIEAGGGIVADALAHLEWEGKHEQGSRHLPRRRDGRTAARRERLTGRPAHMTVFPQGTPTLMTVARKLQAIILALSLTATLVVVAGELPLEGSREIAFQTDAVTWLSLDVSPDGSTIVMEAVGDLYVLPIEGGAARRITSGMAFDSQPKFSPDGERIAFVSDRDGSEDLWIANADGSELGNLSSNGGTVEFASPSWSPDGTHVVASRTKWGLRTFELWAYHVDGGSGVQITEAKSGSDTPSDERANALGAVYSPKGRYLYYARKDGGFDYDVRLPLWQIVRLDLRNGSEDTLTGAQGSAMRPVLSPDGSLLTYVTRYRGDSGLRLRDLQTGKDRWLAYPAQRDDQESRFTRDLFPGYAFTPGRLSGHLHQRGRHPSRRYGDGRDLIHSFHARCQTVHRSAPVFSLPLRARPGEGPSRARSGTLAIRRGAGLLRPDPRIRAR